jgi:hypothetical protein
MKYSLIIQSRNGEMRDYASVCESAEYSTNRTGSPGSLKLTLYKTAEADFHEGCRARLAVDGAAVFFGRVFTKSKDRWGMIEVTCYDQLRYLKAEASYRFEGYTAGEIIRKIASDLGRPGCELAVGEIEDTGYRIPELIKEEKCCLDIISEALELTALATGKIYAFYDDAGLLALKECSSLLSGDVLGSKSRATEYRYTTDIDKDTYNLVKLARPNEETGRADVYEFQSGASVALWGLLQKYEAVDGNMNAAQIEELGKTMLAYYDRTLRTLEMEGCLGIPGLRAGAMILVDIPDLGDISLRSFALLDKVTHRFESGAHLMDVEMRVSLKGEGGIGEGAELYRAD